jgi:hypothetical protein
MTESRREGDPADWIKIRSVWDTGASYKDCAASVDNRISHGTIHRWARREGWVRGIMPAVLLSSTEPQILERADAPTAEKISNTAEMRSRTERRFTERKIEIAAMLTEGIERLYGQIFSPHVLKEAKVVSGPTGQGSDVEIVEIHMDEPSPADKQRLATTLAILIDKASLLSGEATSRTETGGIAGREAAAERLKHFRDDLEERRQKAAEALKDAGEKQTG